MGLVLSPVRSNLIEIDSDSEEERVSKMTRSERPMIGLKSARKKAPSPPENDPPSEDYGDMPMDDGFLEELQKAEEAQFVAPPGPNHASSSRRQLDPDADVITIDDDEEMEDKENVPAPHRHVRRRVFGEVIEIDSD